MTCSNCWARLALLLCLALQLTQSEPTGAPTSVPTTFLVALLPSGAPTRAPALLPTGVPSFRSNDPTGSPTSLPTTAPIQTSAYAPTGIPTGNPTGTVIPTGTPSALPTASKLVYPTGFPSAMPSSQPSGTIPTGAPTQSPLSASPTTAALATTDTHSGSVYVEVNLAYVLLAVLACAAAAGLRVWCFRKDGFHRLRSQVTAFSENLAYASVAASEDEPGGVGNRERHLLSARQIELARFGKMRTADAYPAPLINSSRSSRLVRQLAEDDIGEARSSSGSVSSESQATQPLISNPDPS